MADVLQAPVQRSSNIAACGRIRHLLAESLSITTQADTY